MRLAASPSQALVSNGERKSFLQPIERGGRSLILFNGKCQRAIYVNWIEGVIVVGMDSRRVALSAWIIRTEAAAVPGESSFSSIVPDQVCL